MLSEQATGPAVEQRAPQSPGRSGDRRPLGEWRDVETATVSDVFDVASGLHEITGSFREFFSDDAWRAALDDPERERLFQAQLALAGAFLARLSMFIDDTARDREEMREIHIATIAELRARKAPR